MRRSSWFGVAAIAAVTVGFGWLASPGIARAQDDPGDQQATGDDVATFQVDTNAIDSTTYNRGRNISVMERPRPDYQAQGVQVGGFTIYPKITISGAYDDNVFAVSSNKAGDFIFTETPEIDFQSTWSRDALSGYVRLAQDEYTRFQSEDATQFSTGMSGKVQFGESDLTGGVDWGHFVLSRAASNNFGLPVHPIAYDYTAANGQLATEFTRVRLSIRVDDEVYQYDNGVTAGGTLVFAQEESHADTIVTGKAEVAVSPDTAVYFIGQGNWRNYEINPPAVPFTRDSSGYELDGGVNFDLTHLVRGEVQLGYLSQTYVSPLFRPIEGFSGKAQVEWFPTQLTTVTLVASRSVGDALIVDAGGFLTTDVSLKVDHELRRNVILSADGWYGYDQYNGIDRDDTRTGADVSIDWLISRHLGLTFAYAYSNQQSSGSAAGPSFSDNRGTISFVLQD